MAGTPRIPDGHVALGAWGEALVAGRLQDLAPVEPGLRADLRFAGIEIEVKTARASTADRDRHAPRYQFCLQRQGHTAMHGDVLVLVLAPQGECYVLPAADVPDVRILRMGPRATLAQYRENWSALADLIADRSRA